MKTKAKTKMSMTMRTSSLEDEDMTKTNEPLIVEAPLLADLDRGVMELVNGCRQPPRPDGTVLARDTWAHAMSAARTLVTAAAGICVQAEKLGLLITESDFVGMATTAFRLVASLPKPKGEA